MQQGRFMLEDQQMLVLAGCFSGEQEDPAWSGLASVPQPEPLSKSNAIEADMRIWRHAVMCNANSVLIYSPDTDV